MDFNDGTLGLTRANGDISFFDPLQLHFHSPSEHTINGKYFDVELHIVHKYKGTDSQLGAVLGIFFDLEVGGNRPNEFIESLKFSKAHPEGIPINEVNLKDFLSELEKDGYWSYDGSLTTPPCSEGIKWTIFSDVQSISETQLEGIQHWFSHNHEFAGGKGNNRALQPLNERTLYYSGSFCTALSSGIALAIATMLVF